MGSAIVAFLIGIAVVALVGVVSARLVRPLMRHTAASPVPLTDEEVRRRERRTFVFFIPLGALGVGLGIWFALLSSR